MMCETTRQARASSLRRDLPGDCGWSKLRTREFGYWNPSAMEYFLGDSIAEFYEAGLGEMAVECQSFS